MDAATIAESEREGGGAPSQRRRTVRGQPWSGQALAGTEGSSSWFKRAGIAFLFAGLGAWLGLQLLAASL
jgi:hypothetical protein